MLYVCHDKSFREFESISLIEFEGMLVKCWGHVAGCDMIFGELMTG